MSVVAVASRNTSKGDIPTTRGEVTFRANDPAAEEHEEPAVEVVGAVSVDVVDATLTVTLSEDVPPGPVQVMPKVVSRVSPPESFLPLVATTLRFQSPVSTQVVAFVDVQLTQTLLPEETLLLVTLIEAVGFAAAADALEAKPNVPMVLSAPIVVRSSDQRCRSRTEDLRSDAPCED